MMNNAGHLIYIYLGILIKGPVVYIPKAKQMIMDNFKKTETEKFRVTAPGMPRYFLEPAGQDQLASLETQYKVNEMHCFHYSRVVLNYENVCSLMELYIHVFASILSSNR